MKKIKCFTDQYFPRLLNHKIIMILFFFMLNNVSVVSPTQGATLTVNSDGIIGSLTKTAFSTTPDMITDQHQDDKWANSTFQSATAFGGYLRLPVTGNLDPTQQQNIKSTIDHSKSINREIILLIDFNTIPTNDISGNLSFLQKYFNDNSISWFELGNEVWGTKSIYSKNTDYIPTKMNSYIKDIPSYITEIKKLQPNAKVIIDSIEGNSLSGAIRTDVTSWLHGNEWTKEILDNLGNTIDGISVHLYPAGNDDISYDRYLSLGECVDSDYRTLFRYAYFPDKNQSIGLIKLLKDAIGNRRAPDNQPIKIFFTEYSVFSECNSSNIGNLRNGMHNALVYANTLSYLNKANYTLYDQNKIQVESFGLHQLGWGGNSKDSASAIGWNCLNSEDPNNIENSKYHLIPAALAIKLLSTINGSLISSSLTDSPFYPTTGKALEALTDNNGCLAPLDIIPYVTAFAARDNNDLYISLTNMSNQPVNVDLKIVGSLNLSNTIFTGKCISAPLLTSNNDSGDIDIKDYGKLANGIAILPPYSIVVLHASTPPAPDIKANGQDGQVTVSSGTPVSITSSLAPGNENGKLADWWLAYNSPLGWYSFSQSGWGPGIIPLSTYPLNSIPSVEVFKSYLPVGEYTFYFAVDMNPNGILDSPLYYDGVQIHVTK